MQAAGEIVCNNFATAASCYMHEIDRSHKNWPDESIRDHHFSTEESVSKNQHSSADSRSFVENL